MGEGQVQDRTVIETKTRTKGDGEGRGQTHLASPGLTVVQVAEMKHSEHQVSKVQVLGQGLEEEERQG